MIWLCLGKCRQKMLIRNYRVLFKYIIAGIIVSACLCPKLSAQEQDKTYSFDILAAKGQWEHSQVDCRNVIGTDKNNTIEIMDIDIPEEGDYQLMISLYHSWRKYCPFLYFKLTDAKRRSFSDYTFSEQRFYLEPGQGRWEYRSPSASPCWHLAKGRAKLKFWVEAKNDCWQAKNVDMEGQIYIEKIVLIPINIENMTQSCIQDENNILTK